MSIEEFAISKRFLNFSGFDVDAFWLRGDGVEVKYGVNISAGATWVINTFANHHWNIRTHHGNVLLQTESQPPMAPLKERDTVDVIIVPPTTLQLSLCDLLSNQSEVLFKAKVTLDKIILNVINDSRNERYRTLPYHNSNVQQLLNVSGTKSFLFACGFTEDVIDGASSTSSSTGGLRLSLPVTSAGVDQQLSHLRHCGQLLLDEMTTRTKRDAHPLDASRAGSGSHSLQCMGCAKQIDDGSASLNDAWLMQQGEYRYECDECHSCLCVDCFDRWRAQQLTLSGKQHRCENFSMVKPKTRRYDGPLPSPPHPTSKRNAKFWGY
jgi:hypothetical protein